MSETRRSQLFTLRVWDEAPVPGRHEYRGEVTHVLTGARSPFRDWTALAEFVVGVLDLDAGRPPATVSRTETGEPS